MANKKTLQIDAEKFDKALHRLKKTLSDTIKDTVKGITESIDEFYESIINGK